MIPRSYVIIGCRHFGGRAVEKLHRKDPHSKIIVVDKNKEAIKKISHLPAETVICDGLLYLNKFFSEGRSANYKKKRGHPILFLSRGKTKKFHLL
jgi:hypothetical protein